MSKKKLRLSLLGLMGLVGLVFSTAVPAHALTGLSVTPAYIRVDVPKGENIQYANVALKNDTDMAVKLKAAAKDVDINSSELTSTGTAEKPATKAITIANPSLSLQSHQSVNLIIRIDASSLPAGGQYSSIVIQQAIESSKKNVPIQQAVSVGVFIVKEEGSQRSLVLRSSLPNGVRFSPPTSLKLFFQSSGNVAVVPRAAISVMEGEEVIAKSTINDRSTVIQPGKGLEFATTFTYQKSLTPGRHKVTVAYRYDGQTVPVTKESTFWYVPFWYVFLMFLGVTALILFVRRYLKPLEAKIHDLVVPLPTAETEPLTEKVTKEKKPVAKKMSVKKTAVKTVTKKPKKSPRKSKRSPTKKTPKADQ
jgi:hypothetical protein